MIVPVSNSAAAVPLEPTQVAGTAVGAAATQQPPGGKPGSTSDAQDFASMMAATPPDRVAKPKSVPHAHEPSLLEHFATMQNANMQNLLQSSRDMMTTAPHMSMAEMVSFGAEFRINMAITTTQFHIATNIGKSAGKGIDTLMRNQ